MCHVVKNRAIRTVSLLCLVARSLQLLTELCSLQLAYITCLGSGVGLTELCGGQDPFVEQDHTRA